jgi:hypothetical protein
MTHDEAVAEAERLRREHPQRHRLFFAPRKRVEGDWEAQLGLTASSSSPKNGRPRCAPVRK